MAVLTEPARADGNATAEVSGAIKQSAADASGAIKQSAADASGAATQSATAVFDAKFYAKVREWVVVTIASYFSSKTLDDGTIAHYSWNPSHNRFAETLARELATEIDRDGRVRRFNEIYATLEQRLAGSEDYETHKKDISLFCIDYAGLLSREEYNSAIVIEIVNDVSQKPLFRHPIWGTKDRLVLLRNEFKAYINYARAQATGR